MIILIKTIVKIILKNIWLLKLFCVTTYRAYVKSKKKINNSITSINPDFSKIEVESAQYQKCH